MDADGVERVRVTRFEWERLMLLSPLPWATRSVLLALAVYMSDDGGNARPGMDNLMAVTRLGKTVLVGHLGAAVTAGYLALVERGGHRGGQKRASVYAATVPKDVFAVAADLLASPPWKRNAQDQGTTHRTLTRLDQGSGGRTFTQDQGWVSARSRFGQPDPTTQLHQAEAPSRRAASAAERIVIDFTDATPAEAAAAVALIEREKQPRALVPFVARLADDGELPSWVERVRHGQQRQDVAQAIAAAREGPPCIHGEPGGAEPHPISGLPLCPLCRQAAKRRATA